MRGRQSVLYLSLRLTAILIHGVLTISFMDVLELSVQFSSVAQSCQTLRPHELQHARPPCPSPTPGACSNSCPSSRWCHPTTSSSVVPFSSCFQSFPAAGSFPMSQFFASGGQSTLDLEPTSVRFVNFVSSCFDSPGFSSSLLLFLFASKSSRLTYFLGQRPANGIPEDLSSWLIFCPFFSSK